MITIDQIGAANKCITQEIIKIDDKREKRDTLLKLLGVDKLRRQVENGNYYLCYLNAFLKYLGINVFDKKTLIFVSRKTFADTLGNMLCEAGVKGTFYRY